MAKVSQLPKKAFRKLAHAFGYQLLKDRDIISKKQGYHYVPDIYGKSSHKLQDIRTHEPFYTLAQQARQDKRTFLYFDRLYTLYQAIENLGRNLPASGQPCTILEVGVYKGGGSFFLASCAQKMLNQPVQLYSVDTFTGHSADDLKQAGDGEHLPGQFSETSFESVREYLSPFPFVSVLQGRIQDVVLQLESSVFHLIHLDVDIYEPTLFTLEHFGTRLAPYGIIVVDDYGYTTCPGARRAVDEYIQANPRRFMKFELLTGQCLLVKQGS